MIRNVQYIEVFDSLPDWQSWFGLTVPSRPSGSLMSICQQWAFRLACGRGPGAQEPGLTSQTPRVELEKEGQGWPHCPQAPTEEMEKLRPGRALVLRVRVVLEDQAGKEVYVPGNEGRKSQRGWAVPRNPEELWQPHSPGASPGQGKGARFQKHPTRKPEVERWCHERYPLSSRIAS